MIKVFTVYFDGMMGPTYKAEGFNVQDALDGELDSVSSMMAGEERVIMIKCHEMTQEAYDAMPEFEGY